jgi:3-oxoadipate enol-lactonase
MPFATLHDGCRFYYEMHGAGEPLLLIAGQGTDHTMWDGVAEDFAGDYRVIVYDHRGTGQSDAPTEPPYTTRGFARDAVQLLDHLGIRRAHAYGISMGGRICQWLGIDHPDRVGALVLGCTTPGNAHGVARAAEINGRMANPFADPDEQNAFMLGLLVSPEWAATHPEYGDKRKRRLLNPIPEHARRLHYAASEGHDSWDLLPTIEAPTLVIHGDADVLNPTANAPLLAARIPGAELRLIAGGRHGFFEEFRQDASAAVLEFMRRHRLERLRGQ